MRYQRTLGLDAEQLEELHARVEDILAEPWDKGTGRPKKLTLVLGARTGAMGGEIRHDRPWRTRYQR